MLREYLEKYSSKEYTFQYLFYGKKGHTIVYKILGKSKICGSKKEEHPNSKINCNYVKYTNCEIVDIINNDDVEEKSGPTSISLGTKDHLVVNKTYTIGDIVEDDNYVVTIVDIDEYLNSWYFD